MNKDKYMRTALALYNASEITGEVYDAIILNADEFCDDDEYSYIER